jgi:uncharacterized membrane protein
MDLMSMQDIGALLVFAICWLFYEPLLKRRSRRHGALNTDLQLVRAAWMGAMARRADSRFIDGQLMGHALNSASFFASANLILIAAAAGVLFGGEDRWKGLADVGLLAEAPRQLFELKLGLVTVALSRGLLDFIWSIRQMNYLFAVIGAAPEPPEETVADRYGRAAAAILNPAMSAFNAGVRGYYFALAAAAWLVGPIPFFLATLGAIVLLMWRQSHSRAAVGMRTVRDILAETPPRVVQPKPPAG